MKHNQKTPMIRTDLEKGLTKYIFEGGAIVSVGYGDCHHSETLMGGIPKNFEIAVFDEKGEFIPLSREDDVLGYCTIYHLQDILNLCQVGQHESLRHIFD